MIVIRFSYLDIYNIGIPASEFFIYGLRRFPFLARKGLLFLVAELCSREHGMIWLLVRPLSLPPLPFGGGRCQPITRVAYVDIKVGRRHSLDARVVVRRQASR